MRDIPKSARIDKDKNKETLEFYRECVELHKSDGYDYEKLEPFLTFFDNIPIEVKKLTIQVFVAEINYLEEFKKFRKNNNTKIKFSKFIKDSYAISRVDILRVVNILFQLKTSSVLDDVISDKAYIVTIETLAEVQAHIKQIANDDYPSNKEAIKKFLQDTNKCYKLRQTLEMKQLIDRI